MKRNYSSLTFDELVCFKRNIELQCEHWKSSTDGSHGAALSDRGYFEVCAEIDKRKTHETNSTREPTRNQS